MALRNLINARIYDQGRRGTPPNVLTLLLCLDLTAMISTRGRWLLVILGSVFFLITLSFLPHRGESVAVQGWRAGKKLLSSHDAFEHIYPEDTTPSYFPLSPFEPDLYDTPSHRPDSPLESDLYEPPARHHQDFPDTSDQYETVPHHPDPPMKPVPVEGSISHADTVVSNGSTAGDFRLLIGIMSPFWSSARRQIIRNAYSRFPRNLPVDIIFVEGKLIAPNNERRVQSMQHTVIEWENSTYGDIMHLDCMESLNNGKTYEFLKKVGHEFRQNYTHVMKTDDDAFVNIPGFTHNWVKLISALVDVIRQHKDEKHFYWGTSYRLNEAPYDRIDDIGRSEFWGSGYVLSMDIVEWISTSDIPRGMQFGQPEDWEVFSWIREGGMDDNYVMNRTAFSEYPFPELADVEYALWNDVYPFDRWILVTHPLKTDWMWVEVAQYYLSLHW